MSEPNKSLKRTTILTIYDNKLALKKYLKNENLIYKLTTWSE